MAAYLARASAAAEAALGAVSSKVGPPAVKYYNELMAKNAEYVVKDPAAAEKLAKQLVFTNLAQIPTRAAHAQMELAAFKQTWAKKMDLPLSEVGVYAAFGAEVFAWFCVGEIVGRGGTISGYDI